MSVENDWFILWLHMHTSSHSYTPVAATQGVDLCPQFEKHSLRGTLSASGHGSDVLLNAVSKRVLPKTPTALGGNRGEWTQVSFSCPNLVHLCWKQPILHGILSSRKKSPDKDVEKYITWANKF